MRWAADVGVPEAGREEAQNRYWRSLVAKALLTASGTLRGDPGPVHLNLALREPLMPDDEEPDELSGPWAGRADGAPWTAARPTSNRPRRGRRSGGSGRWSSPATDRPLWAGSPARTPAGTAGR